MEPANTFLDSYHKKSRNTKEEFFFEQEQGGNETTQSTSVGNQSVRKMKSISFKQPAPTPASALPPPSEEQQLAEQPGKQGKRRQQQQHHHRRTHSKTFDQSFVSALLASNSQF